MTAVAQASERAPRPLNPNRLSMKEHCDAERRSGSLLAGIAVTCGDPYRIAGHSDGQGSARTFGGSKGHCAPPPPTFVQTPRARNATGPDAPGEFPGVLGWKAPVTRSKTARAIYCWYRSCCGTL